MAQNPTSPVKYDVVIYGASGFTGKYVIREALKFLNAPSYPFRSLALAGRSRQKLLAALNWADPSSPELPILLADSTDQASLHDVARSARVVLACAGPFRLHGLPLAAACATEGADYLDICGEPEFIERLEILLHEKAVASGSLMVSACGFDSVPAELGFLFNSMKWGESVGVVNRIEAYLLLESEKKIVGNLGTYESAVLGVSNVRSLQELRRLRPKQPRPTIAGRPPPSGSFLEKQSTLALWALKLPSADAVVVRRTLSTLTRHPEGLVGKNEATDFVERRKAYWSKVKPAFFGVKVASKSLLGILKYLIVGFFIVLLGKFPFGRSLLLRFPEFFSCGTFRKRGPTEEEVNNASFKMWFVSQGYSNVALTLQDDAKPDKELITRVSGPEIGYLTTPIILVQCAIVVLGQRNNLPAGGVHTPGVVFGPTDLQGRLQEQGILFDMISSGPLRSA